MNKNKKEETSQPPLTKNNKYSALIGLQILERSTAENEFNTTFENKGKYSIC